MYLDKGVVMSNLDVFTLSNDEYKRNIDPIKHYIEQGTMFLSKSTGDDINKCKEFIINGLKNKAFNGVRSPTIKYLERNDVGDREAKEISLRDYIYTSIKEDEIIAPTLTTYLPEIRKVSLAVSFVNFNKKERSISKKEQFKFEALKDKVMANRAKNTQTSKKLFNNAFSGALVSANNVLYNKTGHSTLTSNCRIFASLGNANNEKVVTGNRHYWSPDVVINNIVSIITNSNLGNIDNALNKLNLYRPNSDDVLECITYSSNLYWKSSKSIKDIKTLLDKCTDVELAAVLYTGDLYHIKKHNDSFIKEFFTKLNTKVTTLLENPIDYIKDLDHNCLNLSHQICLVEAKGKGKEYSTMDINTLSTIVSTCINVQNVLISYKEFIQTFFTTPNVPSSVAYIEHSIRRCVTTSDTDSTIFTVQDWIKWYYGDYILTPESIGFAGCIVFFTAQSIIHVLALTSANIGFSKKNLKTMSMKSEFFWPVFVNTSVAKHYFALCSIKEGNVYENNEKEIKGVHLLSSNSPKKVLAKSKELMDTIFDTILAGDKIVLGDILKDISNFETMIYNSLKNGDLEYYRQNSIKPHESYTKDEESSPYQHFDFWNKVFGPKYGNVDNPPYPVIKINTILNNKTSLVKWLEDIKDKELRTRLADWLVRYDKTSFNTLYIPMDYVEANGIPEEIKIVIDTNSIILDLCNVFYMILESLGYYKKKDKLLSSIY